MALLVKHCHEFNMDKRQVQLRIEELKFQKDYYSLFNLPMICTSVIGMTSVFLVPITYFMGKTGLNVMLWFFGWFLFTIVTFFLVFLWAEKKVKKINLAIKNNYDLLFRRRKENSEVWKRGVMLNKTNPLKKKWLFSL